MAGSAPAIGIDLGTTFSAIARIDEAGRASTLVNRDGDLLTPSVVLIDGDDVVVGKEALKAISTEADRVADCVKRSVGLPFYERTVDSRQYPPEVLQAVILRQLVNDASRLVGRAIEHAVITVPAYFDETRRKSTQDAGYIAGIQVLDIINEPTAAAIAFGYQVGLVEAAANAEQDGTGDASPKETSAPAQTVLVYDLGGGTFDVTIMRIEGNQFITLATDGDVELGGRDFDTRIMEYAAKQFHATHGRDPREDSAAKGRLWRECEEAKRTLSARKEAVFVCEYGGQALRISISRDKFYELTADLLDRTRFTVRQALQAAKLELDQVDRVLMVGGSTRIPAVADVLTKQFGRAPEVCLAADEAIAHGAALRAKQILDRAAGKPRSFSIRNVNSHSLGIVATERQTGHKRSAILIPRNTPLPAKVKRTFKTAKDGQTSVLAPIVEGESPSAEHCTPIGTCEIRDLPEDLPAGSPVEVAFRYAANGRLDVTVELPGTGVQAAQEIHRPNGRSQDELDEWRAWVDQRMPR